MRKIFLIIFILLVLLSCSKSEPVKQPPDIVYFSASNTELFASQETTLTWSVLYANQVQIDNGIGLQAASGSIIVKPSTTTTYTLSATNADGSDTKSVKINVRVLLVSWTKSMTSYNCPQILGTIKNISDKTIYNVGIDFFAYNSANTIIDTASGFPANLGNIPAGTSATFDAIFFKLTAWSQIDHVTYVIDWLTAAGAPGSMSGLIE